MNPLDVLDDLRPDTQHLDPATAARVWERLVAQHPDLADTDTASSSERPLVRVRTGTDVSDRPGRRRSVAFVGAAAAAVVGLVALGVVNRSSPDRPPASATQPSIATAPSTATARTEPAVSQAETDETTETPVSQVEAVESTGDDLAAATGFILPSFVPDGLEITGLSAGRNSMWHNPFGATRWAQVVDGSITKILTVRAPRPIDPREPDFDSDDTVRGVPAEVWRQNGEIGVLWNESGYMNSAESTGLTEAEFLGAVEDLEIDVDASTIELPDGGRSLGLVLESEIRVVADVVTSTVAVADPARPANTVLHAVATPNTFGQTVDGWIPEQPGWEPRDVDGIDMRIRVRPADEGGGTDLRWIDQDVRFQVFGTADTDLGTAIEFARGLLLTDAATFKAAVAELTDRATATMMAWIELDGVTFDDGITATVRSRTEGSGADAICIEAPVVQCRERISEASLADGYSDNVFDTFDIDGRNVVIGWQSNSEAERLGEPTIEPGDALNPADGLSLATTATLDQLVHGTTGRFLQVEVPAGERPPQLNFRSGDNVLHAGPPASRSAYEY